MWIDSPIDLIMSRLILRLHAAPRCLCAFRRLLKWLVTRKKRSQWRTILLEELLLTIGLVIELMLRHCDMLRHGKWFGRLDFWNIIALHLMGKRQHHEKVFYAVYKVNNWMELLIMGLRTKLYMSLTRRIQVISWTSQITPELSALSWNSIKEHYSITYSNKWFPHLRILFQNRTPHHIHDVRTKNRFNPVVGRRHAFRKSTSTGRSTFFYIFEIFFLFFVMIHKLSRQFSFFLASCNRNCNTKKKNFLTFQQLIMFRIFSLLTFPISANF